MHMAMKQIITEWGQLACW